MAPGFLSKLTRSRNSSVSASSSERNIRDRAVTLPGSATSSVFTTSSRPSTATSLSQSGHHDIPKVEVTPAQATVGENGRSTPSTASLRSSVSPQVTVVPPSPQSQHNSLAPSENSGVGETKGRPEPLSGVGLVQHFTPDDLPTPTPSQTANFVVDSPSGLQQSPTTISPNTPSSFGSSPATPASNGGVIAPPNGSPSKHSSGPMTSTKQSSNGVQPIERSPNHDDPTSTPSHGRAATFANGVDPSLLNPQRHRDSDAVSISSTASGRKRGLFRKSSFNNSNNGASTASPNRKPTGLASAIASTGLAMANSVVSMPPMPEPIPATRSGSGGNGSPPGWQPVKQGRSNTTTTMNRSPALFGAVDGGEFGSPLTTSPRSRAGSLSAPGESDADFMSSASGDEQVGFDEDDAQLLDDLGTGDIPVTGFAVASNKRNADFHELFPSIPEGDYLIEDYGCALQRDILIQGRMYISEHHICFHANIFGWVTDVIIPIYEIVALEKKMTAFVIPNALLVTTRTAKYSFASFLSRDTVYDVIDNIRKLERPDDVASEQDVVLTSGSMSPAAAVAAAAAAGSLVVPTHKVTKCLCGKEGKHYPEVALETVVPGTPERIYNLMFASGFIKDFMRQDQKLEDIQISDWTPSSDAPGCLARNMSYIKPLNGSIGPKQTKCEIRDETIHSDFDDYVVTITTTRTPDVPSGNVFAVKTRTCIMWESSVSSRVIVTTQVEWSGRSFIRGIIERSCIEGQKTYHADLDRAMRVYIAAHQTEFIPAGADPALVDAQTPPVLSTPAAESTTLANPAAQAQERERERNARGMQWAYETLEGTFGVARRSTMGALELVREAWEQSTSTAVLWFVIVFLVCSNILTLTRIGKRGEVGRRKELRRTVEREQWVKDALVAFWDDVATAGRGRDIVSPLISTREDGTIDVRTELAEITRALDTVEERVKNLRESLNALD